VISINYINKLAVRIKVSQKLARAKIIGARSARGTRMKDRLVSGPLIREGIAPGREESLSLSLSLSLSCNSILFHEGGLQVFYTFPSTTWRHLGRAPSDRPPRSGGNAAAHIAGQEFAIRACVRASLRLRSRLSNEPECRDGAVKARCRSRAFGSRVDRAEERSVICQTKDQ